MSMMVNPARFVVAPTTWNPSDKSANVVLSNANLDATITGGTYEGVRATKSASTGKYYFEFLIGASTPISLGMANAAFILNTGSYLGYTSGSIGYHQAGTVTYNGSTVATYSAYASGDIIQIAVDLSTGKIWYGKNNTFNGSPSAGTGPATTMSADTFFPAVSFYNPSSLIGPVTLHARTANQTYSPPSGFSAWG